MLVPLIVSEYYLRLFLIICNYHFMCFVIIKFKILPEVIYITVQRFHAVMLIDVLSGATLRGSTTNPNRPKCALLLRREARVLC